MAQAINAELEEQERSIAWLARKADIKYPTLSRRLSGYADFKITEIWRIADALGMDASYLTNLAYQELKEAA